MEIMHKLTAASGWSVISQCRTQPVRISCNVWLSCMWP